MGTIADARTEKKERDTRRDKNRDECNEWSCVQELVLWKRFESVHCQSIDRESLVGDEKKTRKSILLHGDEKNCCCYSDFVSRSSREEEEANEENGTESEWFFPLLLRANNKRLRFSSEILAEICYFNLQMFNYTPVSVENDRSMISVENESMPWHEGEKRRGEEWDRSTRGVDRVKELRLFRRLKMINR